MITEFQGEFRFLSNFWPCEVEFDGMLFQSVEHAYQAAKTIKMSERKRIQSCRQPGQAKRLGKTITLRSDWNEIKVTVMATLVTKKFQDPQLRALLLATGTEEIQEGNTWNDTFWGICPPGSNNGKNILGKILMAVREDLQQ
jgi:ribA/ribD-fused uncharacterized protein